MNFVYADVTGDIAWQPAGFIPRRRDWDGLMPRARRRPLRVGRLPRPGRAADAAQPRARLDPDRQRAERAARTHPAIDLRHRLRVGRPGPRPTHRRGAGRQRPDDASRQSAALQVDVVSRTALRATAAAGGADLDRPEGAAGARPARRLGRTRDARQRAGRHRRGVARTSTWPLDHPARGDAGGRRDHRRGHHALAVRRGGLSAVAGRRTRSRTPKRPAARSCWRASPRRWTS